MTTSVATRAGRVRGYLDHGVHVFKGIPYGASTFGKLRFQPPRPPQPWSGVLETVEYGDQAPQLDTGGRIKLFRSWHVETGESEDCLRLNLWSPQLRDGRKRPVMVWFHGGGFSSLNGSSRAYEGTRLALRGDVVVITLNHRLNVFGYLDLSQLGDERFEHSGVAGQLDLIAALEWVRDHIDAFGGDPQNVTIFGESGGGAKVCALLAMSAARGLFHRAAVQSGALLRAVSKERAGAAAEAMLQALGLEPGEHKKLLDLPTQLLVGAYEKLLATTRHGYAIAPVLGNALPRHPFDPDATPCAADVPLLIGFNRDETSLFVRDKAIFELHWEKLLERLQRGYPKLDAAALITRMRELRPEASPTQLYFAITTGVTLAAASLRLAERKCAQRAAPVYLYQVEWETPIDGGRFGSPHAVEIPFVFDTVGASASMLGVDPTRPQKLADRMSEAWLAFARSGDPNTPAIPHWPAYDLEQRATLVFDDETRLAPDHRGRERELFAAAHPYGVLR